MRQVTKEKNLKVLHPHVAEEWHPTKNGELTPDKVLPGSGRKVWWLCNLGHEWRTAVYHRVMGGQCPYCLGMHPSDDYNLAKVHPEIAAQWHPTKNGKLEPSRVTPGSDSRVWWKCEKGHEWQSTVYNRKNCGCPECGRIKNRAKKGRLTVAKGFPSLVEEWHPTKNGELTPEDVTHGSKKKIWWKCEEGHEWQQDVKSRAKGQQCPYCAGFRPHKLYNLQVVNPELSKEWHPTKNGSLTPEQVTPGSERFVWWVCEKGHVWDAMIYERNGRGSGCPYCLNRRKSNVTSIGPTLAKELHPTKNGELNLKKIIGDPNQEL